MTKKTKFEKKETAVTKATFTLDEVRAFALTGYAQQRKDLYLQKVAERPENPRMVNGLEVLSQISMVADVDMTPLSTRQNMARFMAMPVNGDGYDTETDVDDKGVYADSDHWETADRSDNPPSPHELRVKRLIKKRRKALEEHEKGILERREGGDTPTPNGDPNPAKTVPEPTSPKKTPIEPPSGQ